MFETHIQPRFNETDALGHISNTVMPGWFELARIPLFQIIHPPMTIHDWPIIVAHIDIDYLRQIHLGNDVTIKTKIEKIGTKSITIYQEAWQLDKLAASGRTVMVYFDYQTNTTVALPDELKSKLTAIAG